MAGSIWIWRAVRVLSNSEGIFDHFYRKTDTQSKLSSMGESYKVWV